MKVLILSSLTDDIHAAEVSSHLHEMKVAHDAFRFDEFIQNCKLTYRLGCDQPVDKIEREAASAIELHSYSAVWSRRPGQFSPGIFPEGWIGQMVECEARAALHGMLYSLDCLWVNFPPNDVVCLHKLFQLEMAQRVGLTVPDTLVTNKPELVRQFFDQCKGEVIYKPISELSSFAIPAYENPRGISTLPLRKKDLQHLDQVVYSPHLFQRCVRKAFELRVTMVGRRVFCISIDSQAGKGKLDWRNDYSVDMKPYDLPEELSRKCLELMRILGLNYAAIDFIVTEEGQYVFLEINCAGQYLWIEQRTDMQISLEIARLLAGETPPMTPSVAHHLIAKTRPDVGVSQH